MQIQYKSASERFDLAAQAVEDLRGLAMTLQDIGSYNGQDEQALKLLILNLANAMNILDPARSDELLRRKAEEYTKDMAQPVDSPALGQYL